MTPEQIAAEVLSLLEASADVAYYGEPVSPVAHALQAA